MWGASGEPLLHLLWTIWQAVEVYEGSDGTQRGGSGAPGPMQRWRPPKRSQPLEHVARLVLPSACSDSINEQHYRTKGLVDVHRRGAASADGNVRQQA